MSLVASDPSIAADVQHLAGGNALVVRAGGQINLEAGAKLYSGGNDVSAAFANAIEGFSAGAAAAGLKIEMGQHTTSAAVDTIVTGLTNVVGAIACFNDDPVAAAAWASANVGNQTGSPAAGSFYLKTWMPTSTSNPDPVAATTFSKKVNWIAFGT